MKLGIGTYTYTWAIGVPGHPPAVPMSAQDLLCKAAELGVSVVQFADNLPLDLLNSGELDWLRANARSLGVQIEVGTRGISPKHLLRYLELASFFRSPILRVVIDTADDRPDEDDIVDRLKILVPDIERSGIQLAIENHDRFHSRALRSIIDRTGSARVGICLDTVNSLGALEGPDLVLDVLGPRTVNLHVKDFVISRASHAMGFTVEGRPAGEGMLDVPRVLERLIQFGRDPNAILELWTPPGQDLLETVARENAWAERSIRYLRGLIPDS
jgi:sugar phosphate isomerase/epimerase